MFAKTPTPPYYAVIFSSIRTEVDQQYSKISDLMMELASKQTGFLGVENAQNQLGITVSYWKDTESIKQWKDNTEHLKAQIRGKKEWYKAYKVRICKVEKEYGFDR